MFFLVNRGIHAFDKVRYSSDSPRVVPIFPAKTFSANAQVMQKSGASVHFKMTMQYETADGAVYDTFAECDAASGEWIQEKDQRGWYKYSDGSYAKSVGFSESITLT